MTLPETRILHFTTRMVVAFKSKEGVPPKANYEPSPRPILKSQTKDIFNTTIDEWKNVVEKLQYNKYYNAALKEAEGLGTDAFLESFDMYDIYTEQINKKKIQKEIEFEIQKYKEEREQELLKRQQKKEKADKKKKAKLEKLQKEAEKRPKPEEREVPVVIDEEPIIITFKKELTTTDVIQISRAAKSISKLEKQKEEQTKFLNVALGAIERIEESEKLEFLLSQIVTRDRWLDSINITNTLIERQKEIIEHLKRSTK